MSAPKQDITREQAEYRLAHGMETFAQPLHLRRKRHRIAELRDANNGGLEARSKDGWFTVAALYAW